MNTSRTNDQHVRVCIMLGHALALDEDWAWVGLSVSLARRLSVVERRRLLAAAFYSVTETDAYDVIGDRLTLCRSPYPVPDGTPLDADARWWASTATLPEVRAWLAACYARLPTREQKAFLVSASRRVAA